MSRLDGADMEIKMNPNAVNQFPKGVDLYTEGEPVYSVAMIIKGRVMIHNKGAKIIVGSGTFLGINDLYAGRFQSTYTSYDELLLYVFPITRVEELDGILTTNKDYHGFMVASLYKIIYELDQIYQGIVKQGLSICQFLKTTYKNYQTLSARWGCKTILTDRINQLEIIDSDLELIKDRINYYIECKNLPMDAVKLFYSYGNAITIYQVEDQTSIVNQQMDVLKQLSDYFIHMAHCLVDDSETCLFHLIAGLSVESESVSGSSNDLLDIMDNIIDKVNQAELLSERMLGKKLKVNRKRMEEVYHLLLTGSKGKEVSTETLLRYSNEDSLRAFEELKDSYRFLLGYGGIEGSRAEEMKATMLDFLHLKDKFSTEDTARAIRRQIADQYYELYKVIFLRAYQDKQVPRLVDLFLKYGYADERLLTKDQLLSLYFLEEESSVQSNCSVYNIKDWLIDVYESKREPSKNEFDLEYTEMLAEQRKQGRLTEKDALQKLNDPKEKLEYEILNMFRYNNRTTNGQISSFVPILHKDQWAGDLSKKLVTASRIQEAVASIMRIDFSVFDREVLYVNKEKNITKEYIIKRVFPVIILMPNIGINGIMWQEISGKRRDSAGRFLLPVFTDTNLSLLLVRIFGRYRWELCRTIEGASWNDIKHKSLTSEYTDYLQFYRKNKELSEEKKEKLKNQIQKGRSSSKEIFVIDYEQWINYESWGAMKLNKPVREMMATYCPFSKEIRDQIKLQPLFEEAMTRFNREKLKKVRETEGRYRMLQKDKIELTKELIDTLEYHKNT